MAFEIGIDQTSMPVVDTTIDFTSGELSETPKCAMVMLGDGVSNQVSNDDWKQSIGLCDKDRQGGISVNSQHGVGTAVVSRRQINDGICLRDPSEVASSDKIAFNSFLSNGLRGNTTLTSSFAKMASAIMFGGSDLVACEMGTFAISTAVNAERTINFVNTNLKPNIFLFVSAGTTDAGGESAFALPTFGIAINVGGVITQRALSVRVDVQGATVMDPGGIIHTDRSLSNVSPVADNMQWELELTDVSTGSIGVTPRVSGLDGDEIMVLSMEVKNTNIALVNLNLPTATGVNSFTGVGFKPSWALKCQSMLTEFDGSPKFDASSGVFSIASFNTNEKMDNSWANVDAVGNSNNQSLVSNRATYFPYQDGTITPGAGATNGFNSDTNVPVFTDVGFDLEYEAVNNVGPRVGFSLFTGPMMGNQEHDMFRGIRRGINMGVL